VILSLPRNTPVIALICSITFLYTALPSTATVSTSSNTAITSDNQTSLNQTLTNLVNQTLTNLANQTLSDLNETVSQQVRFGEETNERINQTLSDLNETVSQQVRFGEEAREEVRANATAATNEVRKEFQGAFGDLPNSIAWMLGIAIVFVIGIPVIIDLLLPNRKGRGHRSDLYRALMTFGVIIVVGIVVVYLIALINFNVSATDNNNVEALIDVLKNLSTILGTALAAIVAFYFGAKTAQGQPPPPPPPPPPQGEQPPPPQGEQQQQQPEER
jgi:hypothetical protein